MYPVVATLALAALFPAGGGAAVVAWGWRPRRLSFITP